MEMLAGDATVEGTVAPRRRDYAGGAGPGDDKGLVMSPDESCNGRSSIRVLPPLEQRILVSLSCRLYPH